MAVVKFRPTKTVHTAQIARDGILGGLKQAIGAATEKGATDFNLEVGNTSVTATFYRPQTDEEYADHVLTNTLSDEQREALKLKYNIEV